MELDSVRGLKALALERIAADSAVRSLGVTKRSIQFSEAARGRDRSVGVGIAPHGTQFRLALRVQHASVVHDALVQTLIEQASGEVDLRVTGLIRKQPLRGRVQRLRKRSAPQWFRSNVRPPLIGASIAHHQVTAGTIGAFVARDGQILVLSNNHVLADENRGARGDVVLQRAARDGGVPGRDDMATLDRWIDLTAATTNFVDAATGTLADARGLDATLLRGIVGGMDKRLSGTAVAAPAPGGAEYRVFKLGRTTGATSGRVTAFDVDNVVVGYDLGNATFGNCIEIESTTATAFSLEGDSGSLIVNEDMMAVGLLFAGGGTGGSNGQGLTYANPIQRVLDDLQVKLIT